MRRTALFLGVVVLFLAAPAVSAQGIVDTVVSGDTVTARIALPGGLGADLTIAFDDSVGLTAESAGLSALTVNPLDPNLLSRLLSPLLSLPAAFPVLLRIEPPATGGLSFSGIASVTLRTHNLPYAANSPLRLFKASLGGPFEDVTEDMGAGSYRVRGHSGGFSEFLILVDLRPVGAVISHKFNRLERLLADYEDLIAPAVHADLVSRLAAARSAYENGNLLTAIQRVEGFATTVQANSGTAMPDVWRSAGDLTNVAGNLRAAAGTLRFSLVVKKNSSGLLGLW